MKRAIYKCGRCGKELDAALAAVKVVICCGVESKVVKEYIDEPREGASSSQTPE